MISRNLNPEIPASNAFFMATKTTLKTSYKRSLRGTVRIDNEIQEDKKNPSPESLCVLKALRHIFVNAQRGQSLPFLPYWTYQVLNLVFRTAS